MQGLGLAGIIDQMLMDRPAHNFGATREFQFGKDIGDMFLDGPLAQYQLSGNLPIGLTLPDQGGDLALARGQGAEILF